MGVSVVTFAASASGSGGKTALEVIGLRTVSDSAVTPMVPENAQEFVATAAWGINDVDGNPIAAGRVYSYVPSLGGTGWLLVGVLAAGMRGVVVESGAAGLFLGKENQIWEWDGAAYNFTKPVNGDRVIVIADRAWFASQAFEWDDNAANWKSMGRGAFGLANGVFVDPSGNDDTGNGSLDRPYASLRRALLAVAFPNIYMGPGVYTGPGAPLTIDRNLNIVPLLGRNTVLYQDTVAAGPVLRCIGAAGGVAINIGISVENLAGTPGDIAVEMDNSGGLGTLTVGIDTDTISGQPGGTALSLVGDPTGNQSDIRVNVDSLIGQVNADLQAGGDRLIFSSDTNFFPGLVAFMNITGTAGNVWLRGLMLGLWNAVVDFGGGAPCGVNLQIGSYANGMLHLNNNGGGGRVNISNEAIFNQIVALQPYQQVWKYGSNGVVEAWLYNVDLNVLGPTPIPVFNSGQTFFPTGFRTVVKGGGPTPGVEAWQVDGSAPASIVPPVGPAAPLRGSEAFPVLPDVVLGGAITFVVLIVAGAPTPVDVVASLILQ